jgi:hypothetical protein
MEDMELLKAMLAEMNAIMKSNYEKVVANRKIFWRGWKLRLRPIEKSGRLKGKPTKRN